MLSGGKRRSQNPQVWRGDVDSCKVLEDLRVKREKFLLVSRSPNDWSED